MTERAKERSAFCTRRGLFQFTRMPFGLSGAPSSFCRLMSSVLSDLLWVICMCYLDDIIVYARTPQELLQRLDVVLRRLHQVGLKAKPSKCCLLKTEIKFLGHMVSADGILPLQDKLDAIRDWATPRCLKEVKVFYGLASYYRRFVRDFASVAEPLTALTRKGHKFVWTDADGGVNVDYPLHWNLVPLHMHGLSLSGSKKGVRPYRPQTISATARRYRPQQNNHIFCLLMAHRHTDLDNEVFHLRP